MRALIATTVLFLGCACAESALLDAQTSVHGDVQVVSQNDAEPDAGLDTDTGVSCCPVQSPSNPRCDCVPTGGVMRPGVGCTSICDSHPSSWHLTTDPSGCPTLVWDPQSSCIGGMDASTSSTADAG